MQKKLLIITACMIVAVVIAGIVITDRNSEKNREIEQILRDDSEEETALVSLEEVRKEADAVIGECSGVHFPEGRRQYGIHREGNRTVICGKESGGEKGELFFFS